MDIKLLIIGGKANKSQVAVKLPAVIGRSREADLTVAHPMISRRHCELYEVNGLVMVRDLGSLNGLFVGGRQVNEAALHPNAEFSIGPLTFRVEYEYAGQIAVESDATTISELSHPPEPPAGPEATDFEVTDPPEVATPVQGLGPAEQTPAVQAEPAAGEGLASPADVAATIAPPDGQLPDFSAWGVQQGQGEPQPPSVQPLAPPPTFFADGPPREETAVETGQDATPEGVTQAASEAAASFPETTAFEPGQLAELGQKHPPAIGPAEGDQPLEAPGVEPADSGSAPTQQSTGATDEETAESAGGPASPSDEPPEEGMFDLSAPPAPEADDPGDAGTGDKELDDFLKWLE